MKPLTITKNVLNVKGNLSKYMTEVSQYSLLTVEEETEIGNRARNGDESAVEILVQSNLRFVVSVAKTYTKGKYLSDVINEGNIGLLEAARKFDPGLGFKFISFAVHHIRKSITAFLCNSSRVVRLPMNKINFINKTNEIESRMAQKLGRKPIPFEIVDEYLADDTIPNKEVRITGETLTELRGTNSYASDLFADPDSDSSFGLIDTIDGTLVKPDGNLIEQSGTAALLEYIDDLPEKYREVIKKKYGFNGEPMSNTAIAKEYNRTPEAIRIWIRTAMRLLKHKIRTDEDSPIEYRF